MNSGMLFVDLLLVMEALKRTPKGCASDERPMAR
jgi:hypothetical protein